MAMPKSQAMKAALRAGKTPSPRALIGHEQEIYMRVKDWFYKIPGEMSPLLNEFLRDWWDDLDRRMLEARNKAPITPAPPRTRPRG
jgi:hypothetical protein